MTDESSESGGIRNAVRKVERNGINPAIYLGKSNFRMNFGIF